MVSMRLMDTFDTFWPPAVVCLVPCPPVQNLPQEVPFDRPPPMPLNPPEVRDSPARGKGLFATETIPAYTQIVVDEALISLGPRDHHFELLDKYKLLPADDRAMFDALDVSAKEAKSMDKYEKYFLNLRYSSTDAREAAFAIARFMSNGFKTEDHNRWAHVIFAKVSRINHSCTPNALSHYRSSTGTQHIIALKDIRPGEEIEICYCQMVMSRSERQQRLQQWGFTCTCPACNGSLGVEYEEQIKSIHEWMSYDPTATMTRDSRSREHLAHSVGVCIDIAKRDRCPWLRATLPRLYDALAAIRASIDETGMRTQVLTSKRAAGEWFTRLNGADHPEGSVRCSELKKLEDPGLE